MNSNEFPLLLPEGITEKQRKCVLEYFLHYGCGGGGKWALPPPRHPDSHIFPSQPCPMLWISSKSYELSSTIPGRDDLRPSRLKTGGNKKEINLSHFSQMNWKCDIPPFFFCTNIFPRLRTFLWLWKIKCMIPLQQPVPGHCHRSHPLHFQKCP